MKVQPVRGYWKQQVIPAAVIRQACPILLLLGKRLFHVLHHLLGWMSGQFPLSMIPYVMQDRSVPLKAFG